MPPIIAAVAPNEAPPLTPMPLPAAWVLEGTPTASGRVAITGPAGDQVGGVWQCTAGRFEYHFDAYHETVMILEGQAIIAGPDGVPTTLNPGDFAHFPKGLVTTWHVPHFVKKTFFILQEPTA